LLLYVASERELINMASPLAAWVVNELLCYVQNNFNSHPRKLINVSSNGFYSDDEVLAAKTCLLGIADKMKLDGRPHMISRKESDNKRKLGCGDNLHLFGLVDGIKCTIPTFVAANLKRLPTVSPGDVDIYALAALNAA
jgi:hypothetical protein